MDPLDVFDAGRMTVAQDPTGAAFGVWQAGTMRGAQLANEAGTFTWNECQTAEPEPGGVLRSLVRPRSRRDAGRLGRAVPGCSKSTTRRWPGTSSSRRKEGRRCAAELVDDLRGRGHREARAVQAKLGGRR